MPGHLSHPPSKGSSTKKKKKSNQSVLLKVRMEIEQINSKPSCKNCSKIFSTNSILQIHNTIVHAQVKSFFHCQICQILLYTKTEFDLHIQEGHLQEGNTQKGHTQEEIPRTYSKNEQINSLHKNTFSTKQCHDEHILTVHADLPKLECQICKRSYSSRGNLFKHRKVIHGNFEPVKLMHSSLKTNELRTEQLL